MSPAKWQPSCPASNVLRSNGDIRFDIEYRLTDSCVAQKDDKFFRGASHDPCMLTWLLISMSILDKNMHIFFKIEILAGAETLFTIVKVSPKSYLAKISKLVRSQIVVDYQKKYMVSNKISCGWKI